MGPTKTNSRARASTFVKTKTMLRATELVKPKDETQANERAKDQNLCAGQIPNGNQGGHAGQWTGEKPRPRCEPPDQRSPTGTCGPDIRRTP